MTLSMRRTVRLLDSILLPTIDFDMCHRRHYLTCMEKAQVYLPAEELAASREAAARSGRSVADIDRDALRKQVLEFRAQGPVAHWDGEARRTSIDHDSVHDEV
ncbi:MAG: hypothetical protein KIS73_10950 [Enhydrobacter sp.]|nr:hypothetical protein [Enhydrobacter sp.]